MYYFLEGVWDSGARRWSEKVVPETHPQLLSRAPIRGREHTPPEGTTMRNKKTSGTTMLKRMIFLMLFGPV